MEHFLLSLRVIFPMFFMLALGYLSRRVHLVEERQFDECTSVVFELIMPIHLFMSISKASAGEGFSPVLILVAVGGVLAAWGIAMVVVPKIEPDRRKCSAMVQGFFRSNVILFGLTIAQTLAGDEAAGAMAIISSVVVPTYNILSVITLESFRGGKPDVKNVVLGILKNHLIQGAVLGVLYLASGWTMPEQLYSVLGQVAACATPLAIIAMGGTFHFSALRGSAKQLLVVNVVKLILLPAAVVLPAAALGVRGTNAAVLLCVFCTPVATTAFPMTQKMGGDGPLAGQIVVSTVFFSVFTTFCWVFAMSALGIC